MDGHSSYTYRRASAPTTGCSVYRSHQSSVKNLSFPPPTLEFCTCVLITACQNSACTHSHSLGVYAAFAHRDTHREAGISRLLCEARSSVTDPSVKNKDLSSAVILSLQTRGFCMGLAEPGFEVVIYLFHLLSRAREA